MYTYGCKHTEQTEKAQSAVSEDAGTIRISKRGRHWAVTDPDGQLICLTVYKKGAEEVKRRLMA